MRFAVRVSDPAVAQQLRLMAGEYLAEAEAEESRMVSAQVSQQTLAAAVDPWPDTNPEPEPSSC